MTPYGNVNLDSLFGGIDAATPMQPGDAFTIGNTTFDPINGSGMFATEGFAPVYESIGAPPLFELGGGTPNIFGAPAPQAPQTFIV